LAIGGVVTTTFLLPVRFTQFKAAELGGGIQLQWTNETEENIAAYTVERSGNGRDFTSLATKAPRANNNQRAGYTYLDAGPFDGDNFYRIKALEHTGKAVYTRLIRVNTKVKGMNRVVYPIPVKGGELNLQLSNLPAGRYLVKVYNIGGQEIETTSLSHAGGHISETIALRNLKPGLYTLRLMGAISLQKNFVVE
jgi:hypothetical protein